MLCCHRFDLIDSTYAVALMADRTPAWREVYEQILDELIFRHTGWWAAEDWLTQIGHDPDRANYPDAVPAADPRRRTGATTTCRAGPRTASSRGACSGTRSAPTATCSSRASSSSCSACTGASPATPAGTRRSTSSATASTPSRGGTPRSPSTSPTQWRAHPEGCHCENTKIWPYCLAGAGLGLQLADLAFGTNHHEAFDIWWEHARREYLHLDGDELPTAVTFYYDPIIDEHLERPGDGGLDPGHLPRPAGPRRGPPALGRGPRADGDARGRPARSRCSARASPRWR